MKKYFRFLFLILFHLSLCKAQNSETKSADTLSLSGIKPVSIKNLEFPQTKPGQKIISHNAYSFVYNETHEQSEWVAYELTKEETVKAYERSNKFLPDPAVETNTASNSDYLKSGYDKGHLAPAADMASSEITMTESFYFSNMSPQDPAFNRAIWKKLEELVRKWAVENNSVYIVTGPVLSNDLKTIGAEKISVPDYFYKIILDYTEPGIKAIAFIFPNQPSHFPLKNFAVTIDSAEKFTGIDFFSALPDEQEKLIESNLCLSCWSWENGISFSAGADSLRTKEVEKNQTEKDPAFSDSPAKIQNSTSVQCSELTKKGKRCQRMTKASNGKCYQHGGN
ncbi:MAG: DNA/RNA non-specific endonuclease [Bacteroidia bacterium]|nr:DNA/RNA non-specific endonuclease [Bacteroidia bacterium]